MKFLLFLALSAILCHVTLQDDSNCMLAKGHLARRSLPTVPHHVFTRSTPPLLHTPSTEEAVQTIALTLAGEVPVIGTYLSAFVGMFWPQKDEPSVWEQVEQKVKDTVNEAFTQEFRDFWKYVQREMQLTLDESGPGLEARRYTRLHGLDQQLAAAENKLITRSKTNTFEVLLEFMPFATARLTVLAELVCMGTRAESKLALQMYIHKLAEYVANIPYMIEESAKWRKNQFSCEAYWKWFSSYHCKKWDSVKRKWQETYLISSSACYSWCNNEIRLFIGRLFRKEALAKHYQTLARWAKANKNAKAVLKKEFSVNTANGCYTDSRGTDYTGNVARTASGKSCKNWIDVTCSDRNIGDCSSGPMFSHYNTNAKLALRFAYDGDGVTANPRNYCRNPSEPLMDRFNAPYCFTTGGNKEDCNVPRCAGFDKDYYAKRSVDAQKNDEA